MKYKIIVFTISSFFIIPNIAISANSTCSDNDFSVDSTSTSNITSSATSSITSAVSSVASVIGISADNCPWTPTPIEYPSGVSGAIANGCSYASSAEDGYTSLKNYISNSNTTLKNCWNNGIKASVKNVQEQTEQRKENLTKLKNLEKERLLTSKQLEFLLRQETELLSLIISIEGEAIK